MAKEVRERTIADIPVGKVWQAQQAALMRLQLYMVGRTHEILREVLSGCRKALDDGSPAQGTDEWDGMRIHLATEGCLKAWAAGFAEWQDLFVGLLAEAVMIPLGTLAVLHREAFGPAALQEATDMAMPTPVFKPQLQAITDLKAAAGEAASKVYQDGHNLSQRIWRLDQATTAGIRQTVLEGVASGDSAWRVAQRLEKYLGAGAGCPRWTRSRLYGLTKKDIASGDRTGLYSGDECDGQGVAYNALRLARNEIQKAHAAATDMLLSKIPWIEKEQIHLSPGHPQDDMCDDVISAGENGEGIYQKGEIDLPLHVQCLCYKSGVLESPNDFAGPRLRGWLNGVDDWPEMDQYADWTGGSTGRGLGIAALEMDIARRLVTWLWGGNSELDAIVGAM